MIFIVIVFMYERIHGLAYNVPYKVKLVRVDGNANEIHFSQSFFLW